MKFILTTFLALLFNYANCQISFKTGSDDFDKDLNIINDNAKTDLGLFKTDLSVSFGVSTKKIDYMLSLNMAPGEVYLALEISKIANKSIDVVIDSYKVNKNKGWGVIAKEMGIKPGSPEFHALKGKTKDKKNKGNSGSNGNSSNKGNKGNNGNSGNKKKK